MHSAGGSSFAAAPRLADTARAMSQNLEAEREVALRTYEAWNARDFDACLALRGHEGVRGFWSEFVDPWESVRIEVTDMREAGDTLVVFVQLAPGLRE
jgi:hypothetical protein